MIELLAQQLKACIHCGMCLPACPTYVVTGNEGQSPRGRLYLIDDLVKNNNNDPKAIEYLDSCLSCAGCQSVCPSGVQYLDILEEARIEYHLTNYNKGLIAELRKMIFRYLLSNRKLLNLFRWILKYTAEALPIMSKLIPQLQPYQKLQVNLGADYKPIKTDHYYYATSSSKDTVSLPLGCVMDTLYNSVHWETINVLNACGYNVYIPATNCCGALAYHSGEAELGREQLAETLNILSNKPYPIVINSAGCSAFIKSHSNKVRTLEFIEALEQAPIDIVTQLKLATPLIATYHPACHINHQQGLSKNYLKLLQSIQGLELEELQQADLCCGSAGFYNLIKPKMANAVGELKAKNIRLNQSRTILTANPGCMSQIQAQLGLEYRVMHPISLIKRAIGMARYSQDTRSWLSSRHV